MNTILSFLRGAFLLLALLFSATGLEAQQLSGAYLNGGLTGNTTGVYGTKGVNSNPHPAALANGSAWAHNGKFYMFGGELNGSFSQSTGMEITDRFWQWDEANGWDLISGNTVEAEYANNVWTYTTAVYGTKNTASATNYPGARVGAAYASDGSGVFYMYGGYGVASDGVGALSDLWKYEVSTGFWTWIGGSNLKDVAAQYGTLSGSGLSEPGGRIEANIWVDAAGDVFIFGGGTDTYTQNSNNYNSLMKFNGSDWDWLAGSSALNDAGSGTQPSARRSAGGVYSSDSKFYLFGGTDNATVNNYNLRSDFWSFDGSIWKLVDGTANDDNEVRSPVFPLGDPQMFELDGTIYLQGGYTTLVSPFYQPRYNLMRWNPQDPGFEEVDLFSVLTTPSIYENAYPYYESDAIQSGASFATNNGEVFLFGGRYSQAASGSNNLFVKCNGQSFAYLSGGESISTFRDGSKTFPTSRTEAASCFDTDNAVLYMFGGSFSTSGSISNLGNDLWKFENNEWVWLSGDSTVDGRGLWDLKNTSLVPGPRSSAAMWTDANGDVWLFGGYGKDALGQLGYLNDLWRYQISTGLWYFVKGDDVVNDSGTRGTLGNSDPANFPSSRASMTVWQHSNGHVYLFGGLRSASSSTNRINDFWKWDGIDWTWVGGSSTSNNVGTYGTIGVASPTNYPGARSATSFWGDDDGFYMYGGQGVTSNSVFGYLDQLWFYDATTSQWTWLSGTSNLKDQTSVYGLATDNDASVNPGNNRSGVMWSNNGSDLYLFCGTRDDPNNTNTYTSHNNLWHWNRNDWAWLKGSQTALSSTMIENTGEEGDFSFDYLASARNSPVYWSQGNAFYLWGGRGLNIGSASARLSDMWVLKNPICGMVLLGLRVHQ